MINILCDVMDHALPAQGIILVYDITNRKTFLQIVKWLRNIKQVGTLSHSLSLSCSHSLAHSLLVLIAVYSSQYATSDIECLLIGNKSDLEEQQEVSREEGVELARQLGIPFLETSAKTKYNIDEVGFCHLDT